MVAPNSVTTHTTPLNSYTQGARPCRVFISLRLQITDCRLRSRTSTHFRLFCISTLFLGVLLIKSRRRKKSGIRRGFFGSRSTSHPTRTAGHSPRKIQPSHASARGKHFHVANEAGHAPAWISSPLHTSEQGKSHTHVSCDHSVFHCSNDCASRNHTAQTRRPSTRPPESQPVLGTRLQGGTSLSLSLSVGPLLLFVVVVVVSLRTGPQPDVSSGWSKHQRPAQVRIVSSLVEAATGLARRPAFRCCLCPFSWTRPGDFFGVGSGRGSGRVVWWLGGLMFPSDGCRRGDEMVRWL